MRELTLKLSNIHSVLLSNDFTRAEDSGVWCPPVLPDFAYSDGDEAENYVWQTIRAAGDVSVNSNELAKAIKDWPSTYHLSARRSNLLRPFKSWFAGKRVLEIGCGCGAITRFLGEMGAEVVAVEGSLRRASIARQRTRDLENVEVICSPSDRLPDLGQFDAVLLIGVLEYARVFLGPDGQQEMLAFCRARMLPESKLFIAIENKLGIKYFAGANEDHVNLPMYGINNAYHEHGVVTFGRQELTGLLHDAGFTDSQTYLPLPDYKLPVSMVTPLGWREHAESLGPLAVESAHKDKQVIAENLFSLEQGISNIWKNGLAADLSSSFLMVCSQQPQDTITENVAAYHYSDSRLPQYCKEIQFTHLEKGKLTITPDGPSLETGNTNPVHHIGGESQFYSGTSLWSGLTYIVNRPDWLIAEVGDWARGWVNELLLSADKVSDTLDKTLPLPATYQDALPFNMIRQESGKVIYFDQEWIANEPISMGYIAFRGVFHSLLRITSFASTRFYHNNNLGRFTLDVLQSIGFDCDEQDLDAYLHQEARFMAFVQLKEEKQIYPVLRDVFCKFRAPSFAALREEGEKAVGALAELQETLDEAKTLLTEKEALLQQLEQEQQAQAQILAQQAQLIERQNHDIAQLLGSASWKISSPLRVVGRRVPMSMRAPAKRLFIRCFYIGQSLKVKTGKVLRRGKAALSARLAHSPTARQLKQKSRSAARSLYYKVPERHKGRLLSLAMKVRPGWFLHHPAYQQQAYRENLAAGTALQQPAFFNREPDGHYHLAARPADYVYIPAAKPHYFNEIVDGFAHKPTFSIIVPIYNTPLDLLELMVNSVRSQWYPEWELILANDASPDPAITPALNAFDDPRIKVVQLEENQGIAGATNVAIDNATGEYIVFLDHDDELTDDCLFELVKCINAEDPDFIYSDEDKFTPEGNFSQPHFKPDWSPDTMMGTMFTCHVACVRLSVARQLGGLRSEFNGCQDWDFILRLTEITDKISHIPKVLYHWRIIPASVASDMTAKPYVLAASRAVRESALARRGLKGTVEELPNYPGYFRVNYAVSNDPLISIIIPTRDNHEVLARCIDSILAKSRYPHYEIVVVDNGSRKPETVAYLAGLADQPNIRMLRHDKPFNFSELNNRGVEAAQGSILLFLNDDTEVLQEDWLERMAGYAQLKHIGAVGAKLVYGDQHTLQHSGVLNLQNGPMHAYMRQHKDHPGYFLRNQIEYNWLAVTGACLMVERAKYEQISGFDETFPVAYNDVDLCMKLVENGFYNVMCQSVTLVHHESVSRGLDHMDAEKVARLHRELSHLYSKHPHYFQYDPFYNVNFAPNGYNFEIMQ